MNYLLTGFIGFLLGTLFILIMLDIVKENRWYMEGWRQAEIHYIRTNSLKFEYKLTVDSSYIKLGE